MPRQPPPAPRDNTSAQSKGKTYTLQGVDTSTQAPAVGTHADRPHAEAGYWGVQALAHSPPATAPLGPATMTKELPTCSTQIRWDCSAQHPRPEKKRKRDTCCTPGPAFQAGHLARCCTRHSRQRQSLQAMARNSKAAEVAVAHYTIMPNYATKLVKFMPEAKLVKLV